MAAADLTQELAQVGAIVLTGGRSTRMGTDKASLVVDGSSMLDRVLAAVAHAGIDRVVIADANTLPDADDGATTGSLGPLAGVVSGWRKLSRQHMPAAAVVLSCDLPAITGAVLTELVVAASSHEHGALAHDGERPQPLVAVYRACALRAMVASFEGGERSIRRCFNDWDLAHVQFDAHLVTDADTPDDLGAFMVDWPGAQD